MGGSSGLQQKRKKGGGVDAPPETATIRRNLTRLSLGKLPPGRACLRFTGRDIGYGIDFPMSNGRVEQHILFRGDFGLDNEVYLTTIEIDPHVIGVWLLRRAFTDAGFNAVYLGAVVLQEEFIDAAIDTLADTISWNDYPPVSA